MPNTPFNVTSRSQNRRKHSVLILKHYKNMKTNYPMTELHMFHQFSLQQKMLSVCMGHLDVHNSITTYVC